jgi:hypothetical protein
MFPVSDRQIGSVGVCSAGRATWRFGTKRQERTTRRRSAKRPVKTRRARSRSAPPTGQPAAGPAGGTNRARGWNTEDHDPSGRLHEVRRRAKFASGRLRGR